MFRMIRGWWPLFIVCLFIVSCRSLQFYKETDHPFFHSEKDSFPSALHADVLNVVTFNIKKSRKIQLAISELQHLEKTRNVDLYLLQEMDEKGTIDIAKALHLHYLYIPICYDRGDKKNIGNAILTKGTIEHPEKLILPHAKWQNQQRRDVTIGEVNIHNKQILVYSVHTETFAMSRKKRMDQVDSVIAHAKMQMANYKYVVIGGDFNTVFAKDGRWLVSKFQKSGFNWSTASVGSTAKGLLGLVKPTNDYIFSNGFNVMNAARIDSTESSDHFPVFTSFRY